MEQPLPPRHIAFVPEAAATFWQPLCLCISFTAVPCCCGCRLAELRVAQAEQIRQELVASHVYEVEEAHRINEEEAVKFEQKWTSGMREFDANFAQQVSAQSTLHTASR